MKTIIRNKDLFYSKIIELLKSAQGKVIHAINHTMVITYYEIGRIIVQEEQAGNLKATYGKNLINELSSKLTAEFGKGFSATNIKQMRSFYIAYAKGQTPSDEFKLSWSHYLKLMRIEEPQERLFYEIEAFKQLEFK